MKLPQTPALKDINWLAAGACLVKIGLGAFLISTGNVVFGAGLIAAAVGIDSISPTWIPTKLYGHKDANQGTPT